MERGTILIADDEDFALLLLGDLLCHHGYRVETAADGETALQKALALRPDAVLLDVMMPKLDGFGVCARLKAAHSTRAIPVLLVTALNRQEFRLRGIEAGADDFLNKPYDASEITLRVRNAVRTKRLFDESESNYQRLARLERSRDELVHMLVHDLRNPLAAASLAGEMLEEELKDRLVGDESALLSSVREGLGEVSALVNQILEYSRLESDRLPVDRTPVELVGLITRSATNPLLAHRHVVLDLPAAPLVICTDKELLNRVLENLLSNAVKYTKRHDMIRISLGLDGKVACLAVEDSGCGFDPAHAEAIFDKFFQVERRGLPGASGSSGLGLSFCKLAAEALGGSIRAESQPGRGSRFVVSLPGVQCSRAVA
ncbi:MAG: hybrid sensor histidine kinase/response regulator [Candidatus Eremiobacteraeota bacterium]|nr:hybrid sensor histidine kinase/response regulator [Candidatus Eremiobacteraeota bacterium]